MLASNMFENFVSLGCGIIFVFCDGKAKCYGYCNFVLYDKQSVVGINKMYFLPKSFGIWKV